MNPNTLQVVTAIIKNQDGQILISKRLLTKHLGGLWEFPGGKIERDETHWDALVRELKEEVDIEVIAAEPAFEIPHEYLDLNVNLNIWFVTKFTGDVLGREGQEIRWVNPTDLSQYEFPEANLKIIKKIL